MLKPGMMCVELTEDWKDHKRGEFLTIGEEMGYELMASGFALNATARYIEANHTEDNTPYVRQRLKALENQLKIIDNQRERVLTEIEQCKKSLTVPRRDKMMRGAVKSKEVSDAE